jgi:hypothetical protein
MFCFRFFPRLFFPQAPENNLGSFQFFSKICEDICKSRCNTGINKAANLPPVSATPAANFAKSSASLVDTGGKQWEQYQTADNLK